MKDAHAGLCKQAGIGKHDGNRNRLVFLRSRQKLWNKGETSGNFIFVSEILTDCDDDTLIYRGIPKGPTCHTGNRTCFYQEPIWKKPEE